MLGLRYFFPLGLFSNPGIPHRHGQKHVHQEELLWQKKQFVHVSNTMTFLDYVICYLNFTIKVADKNAVPLPQMAKTRMV